MAAIDHAVEMLRDRILSGRLTGGTRLGEVELANELGMSRTPVRQALLRLAAEGLVDVTPNRGARVIVRSDSELEYVFEMRARLEGLAARRAAEWATAEQLDLLDKVAHELAACCQDSEPGSTPDGDVDASDAVTRLNGQFHGLLLEIADSATLAGAVNGLLHASVLARTRGSFDRAAVHRSNNHHLEIVAALRANDPDWAESVMRSHLLSARASLLGPRARTTTGTTSETEEIA